MDAAGSSQVKIRGHTLEGMITRQNIVLTLDQILGEWPFVRHKRLDWLTVVLQGNNMFNLAAVSSTIILLREAIQMFPGKLPTRFWFLHRTYMYVHRAMTTAAAIILYATKGACDSSHATRPVGPHISVNSIFNPGGYR